MELQIYKERIREEEKRMRDVRKTPSRPAYHLTPLSGTLADPNGLCRVGDTYHICCVANPLACVEKGRTACVWIHYSTKDFIHYRREPVAIWPDDPRDQDGVYSGSALLRDGKLYLYYTGNVRHPGNYDYIHQGREQNLLRVESADAVCFENKTLLMTNEDFPADLTRHVRDPQLVEKDGAVYMLLGARTLKDTGCVLVYRMTDLSHFELINRLETEKPFGYMWECPDLVCLDGQEFLTACPQGIPHEEYRFQNAHQCGWFPLKGDLAGEYSLGEFSQFDYGFDFYAARTLKEEGRTLLIGWLGMSETDYGRTPSVKEGWDQAVAMPRELSWKEGRIYQKPLEELKRLRERHIRWDGRERFLVQSDRFELELWPESRQDICVRLREDCCLVWRADSGELLLEMGDICGQGRGVRKMRLEELRKLQIFGDASILEIFINDGYAVMTNRIFGERKDLEVEAFTGALDFYELRGFETEEADGDKTEREERHEHSF